MNQELPLFDAEDAIERVGGDQALLRELIEIFKQDYTKAVETMAAALHRSDFIRLDREAHGLAGSLVNLGAKRAAAAAQALCAAALAGSAEGCTAKLRELALGVQGFVREAG